MKVAYPLLGVVLACWLVLASFMVVLSPPVTHQLAEANVNTVGSSHTHDYLVSIADAARAFSLGDDTAAFPRGSDSRTAFTPDVIGHLLDVRVVFQTMMMLFGVVSVILLAVLIVSIRLARRAENTRAPLGDALIGAGSVPLVLCGAFALIGFLAFEALFAWMHSLFFAAGTWQFSYDSLLIRALPEGFWVGCAAVWAGTLVVVCLLSIFAGVLLKRSYSKSIAR